MTTNLRRSIAKALLDIGAVGFSPGQPITFKSGILSPVYVDNRSLVFHPAQWRIIIDAFAALIREQQLDFDVIAGVALGGVPHSSALAYQIGQPSVFIRKGDKAHGKGKRIEGGDVGGIRVLLLEDLITTGGSSLSAVSAVRDAGAIVSDVIAIVSYGFAESERAFAAAEVKLHTLVDFETILQLALERELFSAEDEALIRSWFVDPHNWKPGAI